MDKKALLKFLISVFPNFESVWKSEHNLFRENDEFTASGVCAEFSHYFQDNYIGFSDAQLKTLFNKIEEIAASKNEDEINTALHTCFLENISQTKSGNDVKQFMGKLSKEFFDCWN